MAHGIKKILINKKEDLECNNNQHQQNATSICQNKMALNNLLLDNCCYNSSNQNLLNQKNSSTTNTTALALPTPTQQSSLCGNKLSLNSSGASMSTITSSSSASSTTTGTKMGSRRIFTPQFKLQVLESYRNDNDCKGNQRATARKYGIHRRQIQKWLQCENNLRSIIANNPQNVRNNPMKSTSKATAPILSSSSSSTSSRQRGVVNTDKNGATYSCFSLTNVKNFKSSNIVVGSSSSSSTKSLSVSSLNSGSCINNATAIETNKNIVLNINNNHHHHHFFFQNNTSNSNVTVGSIYSTSDDVPIDLSCSNSNNNQQAVKVKTEYVARPIPLHPSSSNYKIPFYNYTTVAHLSPIPQQQQPFNSSTAPSSSSSPHHLIDISNSVVVKSELIDPIDLSIPNVSHKRKHSTDSSNMQQQDDNKKPIKLFRPYLETNFDSDEKDSEAHSDAQKFPIIWSNAYNLYPDQAQPDYHPFLNAMTSSPVSFSSESHHHHYHPNLSIPMSPPSTLSSPNDSGIMMSNSSFLTTLLPASQASPVSGYDSSTSSIYSFNDNEVDLGSQGHSPPYTSSHYDAPSPSFSSATMSPIANETKVPLLSSSFLHDLKFKLHTLDCYYNDAECKRNEKLVANKLNINCKVVEKWLRQESDLRHQQKQYHLQILV